MGWAFNPIQPKEETLACHVFWVLSPLPEFGFQVPEHKDCPWLSALGLSGKVVQ